MASFQEHLMPWLILAWVMMLWCAYRLYVRYWRPRRVTPRPRKSVVSYSPARKSIRVYYYLSEKGQREALRKGVDHTARQTFLVWPTHTAWDRLVDQVEFRLGVPVVVYTGLVDEVYGPEEILERIAPAPALPPVWEVLNGYYAREV